MAWGSSNGSSNVRLNYAALDQALQERANNNRARDRSQLFLYRTYVTARREDVDIVLRLHATDIVTYRPNGLRTLQAGGWITSQLTRHWFGEAGLQIGKANHLGRWSQPQYGVYCSWQPYSLFYDGMQVDPDGIPLQRKPFVKRVPNAEAKILRKRLTALGALYKPYAMMQQGTPLAIVATTRWQNVAQIDPAHHEIDIALFHGWIGPLQYNTSYTVWDMVKYQLARVYEAEVNRLQLFDETEVY